MANCKNELMEVWEQRYPVRFRHYEPVEDSVGPEPGAAASARPVTWS